jgi:hypothetical protein
MAGGKRVKFQDTRIQFLTGWSGDSPSDTVIGITKANPAVANITAHGRSDGDVVRLLGALGMTEVNGIPYVVDSTDSSHYKLLDVNSTDYGAYTANSARADLAVFSTLCELTGFNRQGGTSPEIDATTQCSEAQEFEIGLPDFGTVQVDFNYAPDVAVQQAIETAYLAGSAFAYKINFYRPGEARTGTPFAFKVGFGTVQQTSEQGQVGGVWTGSFTMRLTGKSYVFVNGAQVS